MTAPRRRRPPGGPRGCCAGTRPRGGPGTATSSPSCCIAEFAEQPRSWRRAADIARGGLLARLTRAGLTGHQPPSAGAGPGRPGHGRAARWPRSSPSGSRCWPSWPPAGPGRRPPPRHDDRAWPRCPRPSCCWPCSGCWPPSRWPGARRAACARRRARQALRGPVAAGRGGGGSAGRRAVTTSRAPGRARALIPGPARAWCPRAWPRSAGPATLSVSAYWAHPAALAAFPGAEIAWMAASPARAGRRGDRGGGPGPQA